MGTRADFYDGRGETAEWVGSIAWDGYPKGIPGAVLNATSRDAYREAVAVMLNAREDATPPYRGWPWPWADSATTDYAYAFEDGRVWVSSFGGPWIGDAADRPATFPNMGARRRTAWDERSGVLTVAPQQPMTKETNE